MTFLFDIIIFTTMQTIHAEIMGHWKIKTVLTNGNPISPSGFVRDLKADEKEEGDNNDIIRKCKGVRRFSWGDTSQATYCLSLACCFYLKVKLVMDRFFVKELEGAPKTDLRLVYDNHQLETAYQHCEDLFAQEFTGFMKKLGAIRVDE
jgi:hypothetical protein